MDNTSEKSQKRNNYLRDDVPFQDISKGIARQLIYFGTALFVILILLSLFIKIPRELNLPFELRGGLNEIIFQYPEVVYLQKYYVKSDDTVNTGDRLLQITSPGIINYLEEYNSKKAALALFESNRTLAHQKEMAILDTRLENAQKELKIVGQEKTLLEQASLKESENLQRQLETINLQHQRNIELKNEQVISDLQLEESLKQLQDARQQLITVQQRYALQIAEIENRIEQLQSSKRQLQASKEKLIADLSFELAGVNNELDLVKRKIELSYGPHEISDNSIILLSPASGVLTLRNQSEYEIAAGEILLRIKISSLQYVVFSEAGPAEVGHIQSGTPAVLKFESFPHYYYGTMHASVSSISSSPADNGFYPVSLQITDTGRLASKVTKGMTGTATFIVEEKPLAVYLLRGFLKIVTLD
ncbi:MAG: hypothetical protein IPM71_00130 [Bacteroidota bacterium]|nr:MAG: hypothetical protein IPM71_00130 [Bacteroidota bacterium]